MTEYRDTLTATPDSTFCQVPAAQAQPGLPPEPARRGNGNVAQLPTALRDQINHWIYEGVSYPDIIRRLENTAKFLTPKHLSEYKKYS